ncbi:MAG TPA: ComEC/Rec2 family competence protein [Solirubrobacterales bacterium]|nr:ComEC/Rec2 family competence protein [Solirubrobacterales bacterium]
MRSPHPPLPILLGIAVLLAVALPRAGEIRERAEDGLGRGMPAREAALARGFVLGQDEQIDAVTKEDFRRSGLAHLLAVSGQNVTLLALLAMPLLGALGIPLRERLVWILALIAIYVPLAGAGPSIQRAAVMGGAGMLATLGGRRACRLHALVLALVVTVAIDPTIAGDVGWQLSFAAVLGILLLAAPLREALLARWGQGAIRRALAEGIAVTVAATLATAPLIAFYFETFSTVTLLANVAAMPAVAPAMWLGMASAAASQVPAAPVELLNGLNALLLAYIAQVAAWCGRPGWAQITVHLGPGGVAATYAALTAAAAVTVRLTRRRERTSSRYAGLTANRRAQLALVGVAAIVGVAWAGFGDGGRTAAATPPAGLRVTVLDVGQGDAILLQPAGAPAVLVDGGPPGDGLAGKLAAAGVERLGAAVVTHDESDHVGGIEEILGRIPISRLVFARVGGGDLEAARAAGAAPARVAAGSVLRSGSLKLEAIWPPPALLDSPPGDDPNAQAVVLLARWHNFSMLLCADAEAEAVPLDPGPVDVLKVAHHGSSDAGLAALLERLRPHLAVISVGEGNSYGHPDPGTLATLAAHGVRTVRTDRDGEIAIEVRRNTIAVKLDG